MTQWRSPWLCHVLDYVCLTCQFLPFHRYDHQERLSAKEAMAHAYFAPVREAAVRGTNQAGGSNYAV